MDSVRTIELIEKYAKKSRFSKPRSRRTGKPATRSQVNRWRKMTPAQRAIARKQTDKWRKRPVATRSQVDRWRKMTPAQQATAKKQTAKWRSRKVKKSDIAELVSKYNKNHDRLGRFSSSGGGSGGGKITNSSQRKETPTTRDRQVSRQEAMKDSPGHVRGATTMKSSGASTLKQAGIKDLDGRGGAHEYPTAAAAKKASQGWSDYTPVTVHVKGGARHFSVRTDAAGRSKIASRGSSTPSKASAAKKPAATKKATGGGANNTSSTHSVGDRVEFPGTTLRGNSKMVRGQVKGVYANGDLKVMQGGTGSHIRVKPSKAKVTQTAENAQARRKSGAKAAAQTRAIRGRRRASGADRNVPYYGANIGYGSYYD